MATAPQLTANRANSLASTGPRTAEGKAQSAQNAVTSGLFTQRDFVRPAEQAEYTQLRSTFETELNPQNALEHTFVATIVGAAWRLRRCSQVEAEMAEKFTTDPMEDDDGARTQRSVDRARAQAFNILRRSTSDLRGLQTDRAVATEMSAMFDNSGHSPEPGLIDYRHVNRALHELDRSRLLVKKLHGLDSLAGILNQPLPPAARSLSENSAPLASSCKPAAPGPEASPEAGPIGRNTPCPCGSGAKYKRCCGKNAPALLHQPLAHPLNHGLNPAA